MTGRWMEGPQDWLVARVTVEDAITGRFTTELLRDCAVDPANPFLEQLDEGDELWEFCSPEDTWACLAGRAGLAVVRAGQVVKAVVLVLN